ncbi:hypothetical protein [Mycobacterium sp. IDR2000157661]|uniref:hypothetical protein n=1 Tax=Mycobacterium sp. IDR2000157661 TaxID=2867005 RepID=UPI001EEB8E69|nr:hypothetical protein [Mycobacterium sp. IDR2000157661]ULE34374.1 hypothetical protein K3G64_06980 [Mycobacterium sp. IDR2000157661]
MSAKAQRELIKAARPGAPVKSSTAKRDNASKTGIPVNDHTERDKVLDRLKERKRQ